MSPEHDPCPSTLNSVGKLTTVDATAQIVAVGSQTGNILIYLRANSQFVKAVSISSLRGSTASEPILIIRFWSDLFYDSIAHCSLAATVLELTFSLWPLLKVSMSLN